MSFHWILFRILNVYLVILTIFDRTNVKRTPFKHQSWFEFRIENTFVYGTEALHIVRCIIIIMNVFVHYDYFSQQNAINVTLKECLNSIESRQVYGSLQWWCYRCIACVALESENYNISKYWTHKKAEWMCTMYPLHSLNSM